MFTDAASFPVARVFKFSSALLPSPWLKGFFHFSNVSLAAPHSFLKDELPLMFVPIKYHSQECLDFWISDMLSTLVLVKGRQANSREYPTLSGGEKYSVLWLQVMALDKAQAHEESNTVPSNYGLQARTKGYHRIRCWACKTGIKKVRRHHVRRAYDRLKREVGHPI